MCRGAEGAELVVTWWVYVGCCRKSRGMLQRRVTIGGGGHRIWLAG